jgi:hypothetical protein
MTGGRRTPTVVVAVHDGFYGAGTGAGRSNHAFLTTLAANLSPGVRLVVLPVHLTTASNEYDPRWHANTLRLLQPANPVIRPVDNGTRGLTRFAGLPAFGHLAADTAAAITGEILPTAGPLAILLFDPGPAMGMQRSAQVRTED